jgi:carbamoyltransferase
MFNKSFLITLGHNSSVIYFEGNGAKPIGYEEERLSKKKSDSSYPILAFEKVLSQLHSEQIDGSNVFISHWFDNFEIESFPKKYFNHSHFNSVVEDYGLNVIPLSSQFTHHDAHAYSTLAFAENFKQNERVSGDKHYIVADGFGNNQEVISIYKECLIGDRVVLEPIHKVYGYTNSLGLLYQHATSYTGMKENQDEYKFLGYESSIKNVLSIDQIEGLSLRAYNCSMQFMKTALNKNTHYTSDGYVNEYTGIDIEYLHDAKCKNFQEFIDIENCFLYPNNVVHNDETVKIVIGFYVQSIIENCLLRIIEKFQIKNAYLSGGCFLNVKLNKLVLDSIPGYICVNPLSGDQGAAIGLFRKYTNSKFNFSDLCFGVRQYEAKPYSDMLKFAEENIFFYEDDGDFVEGVIYALNEGLIVNVIQGNMEFGPRALCNTSTLAMPTAENAAYINKVNDRNEVMPMAPVISEDFARSHIGNNRLRVIGSNHYMIITHDYKANSGRLYSSGTVEYAREHRGVLHSKPIRSGFTCRPQIVSGTSNIAKIVENFGALINTSFNTHGTPILYSIDDAIEDFKKQQKNDSEEKLILIILNIND